MNIVYFHGFGSAFDPDNDKVRVLEELGTVFGLNIDYTIGADEVIDTARDFALDCDVDLIVGTSMGGWLASHVATALGVPFVSLNPAIEPSFNLEKYAGKKFTDFTGKICEMKASTVVEYPDFKLGGFGLILLEEDDDVIDPFYTSMMLDTEYELYIKPGGNHRYTSLKEDVVKIQQHYDKSELGYN